MFIGLYNISNWDYQIREMIGMTEAALEKGGVESPLSGVSSFGPAIMFSGKGKGRAFESLGHRARISPILPWSRWR